MMPFKLPSISLEHSQEAKQFLYENVSSLAALAAPLVFIVQKREMSKWRQVLISNNANFSQAEDKKRMGNIELFQKMGKIMKLGMGRREIIGWIIFCSLFFLKSVATWTRVSTNSQVLEAFAFGTGRKKAVLKFCLASLALAAVESTITHTRFWLIASIRECLSRECHKILMARERFARAKYEAECDAATSIPHYCGEFAEHFAELPYYFLSPSFDAGVALLYFWKSIGSKGTRIMTATTFGSMFLIRRLQPDLARLHARVVTTEGAFQKRHFAVQERSEAISMAAGSSYFYEALNRSLRSVYAASCRYAAGQANFFLMFRIVDLAIWEVVPLVLWLSNDSLQGESAVRTLVMQRDACRRFTKSVAILFKNLREVSHLKEFVEKLNIFLASLGEVDVISGGHDPAKQPPRVEFAQPKTIIEFNDVTIRTPANVALPFCDFSLKIEEGHNYLIVGKNGVGKSSMQRALRGLWPVSSGRIRVAKDVKMLTLPQQAFHLPEASLREQLWFPQRPKPFTSLSFEEIQEECRIAKLSLEQACIEQIIELIGGWDSPNCGFSYDYEEILEAQRKQKDAQSLKKKMLTKQKLKTLAILSSNKNSSNTLDDDDAASPSTTAPAAQFTPDSPGYAWQSLSGGQSQKLALARVFFTIQMTNSDIYNYTGNSMIKVNAFGSPQMGFSGQQHQSHQHHNQSAANSSSTTTHPMSTSTTTNPAIAEKSRFLVLLDESTSQVDSDAEDKILTAIRELPHVTIMCISHRKHSIAHADKILLIGHNDCKTPQVFTREEFMQRGEWLSASLGLTKADLKKNESAQEQQKQEQQKQEEK